MLLKRSKHLEKIADSSHRKIIVAFSRKVKELGYGRCDGSPISRKGRLLDWIFSNDESRNFFTLSYDENLSQRWGCTQPILQPIFLLRAKISGLPESFTFPEDTKALIKFTFLVENKTSLKSVLLTYNCVFCQNPYVVSTCKIEYVNY